MRRRLDVELVRRGLVGSRQEAQAAVASGRVTVGGAPALKSSRLVGADEPLVVLGAAPPYVTGFCQELTGGLGVDYAFEAAGVAALVETGIAATRLGGTTVCVDAPPVDQDIKISPAVLFTVSEKKLLGCLLGSVNARRDVPRLLELAAGGRLDLAGMITYRFKLGEIEQAVGNLRDLSG